MRVLRPTIRPFKKSGSYIIAEALQSPKVARTVAVREKKVSIKAGPFAESAEPLVGFILIRAQNMAKAEKIAAGIPLAQLGTIEVRPIFEF